jgi:hypothetical protein
MTVPEAKGYEARFGQESEVCIERWGPSREVVVPSFPALKVRNGPLITKATKTVWPSQRSFCNVQENKQMISCTDASILRYIGINS